MELFNSYDDANDIENGISFRTDNHLPWAIHFAEHCNYPIEKKQIIQSFNHFADWAQSDGQQYQDWYQDIEGYQNDDLIYNPQFLINIVIIPGKLWDSGKKLLLCSIIKIFVSTGLFAGWTELQKILASDGADGD